MTSKIEYLGHLSTSCTHLESGTQIITDAPKDNQGNGEAFSPTDLTATSLGACILSIMGIKARDMNIDIKGTTADITKIMHAEPRRIGEIHIVITFPAIEAFTIQKNRDIFERVAMNCPVYHSLHPAIIKKVEFKYQLL
jgi:uncharacterized OsmC-like protein